MRRLISYIENELDRNQMYFGQAEASMDAAISFIDHVLKKEEITKLTHEERVYIDGLKECYRKIQYHLDELKEEITRYKRLYPEFLASAKDI